MFLTDDKRLKKRRRGLLEGKVIDALLVLQIFLAAPAVLVAWILMLKLIRRFWKIPIRVLKELKRVLKPDGILCLVEAFMDRDYSLTRTEIKWAESAGFTLDSMHGNWFLYYLLFSKSTETVRDNVSRRSKT